MIARFVLNGLAHANTVLGRKEFQVEDWKVIGEYVYDKEGGRHQAFFLHVRDVIALGTLIKPRNRIQVEQSLKYSEAEAQKLWNMAGMAEIGRWTRGGEYG